MIPGVRVGVGVGALDLHAGSATARVMMPSRAKITLALCATLLPLLRLI
jgi:hypothetical protein